jgi:uncharacterized protein DUF547
MRSIIIFSIVGSLIIPSLIALAAPKAELWERWSTHDPESTLIINHDLWDQFLKTYIVPDKDGLNLVAYGNVTDEDRQKLKTYLKDLQNTPISKYNRAEQRAFWINLYNALTINVIVDHYPVKSIMNIKITPGAFKKGPWGKKLVIIENENISLDQIEHRILRPIWKDPRLHYAVNCASIGCPNLQTQAFTAQNSELLLDKAAKDYINHPRGVWFKKNKLYLSSIYKWFAVDFGGDDASIIKHLKQYAASDLREQLEQVKKISGYGYDWNLNESR